TNKNLRLSEISFSYLLIKFPYAIWYFRLLAKLGVEGYERYTMQANKKFCFK
ncbi:hypothetical protein DB41_EU00010, partial [Neochlamydia sp. TUME1]